MTSAVSRGVPENIRTVRLVGVPGWGVTVSTPTALKLIDGSLPALLRHQPISSLGRVSVHFAPKNMGLGIAEPSRREIKVPGTALLLQDDLTGTGRRRKSDIIRVPAPSKSPRDPLVGRSLQCWPMGFGTSNSVAYHIDKIGHYGRRIFASSRSVSHSRWGAFKLSFCKQSMGFSHWISPSRLPTSKICPHTHRLLARFHVYFLLF